MKKYFLSFMLVMGVMAPAFSADGIITGGAGTCTVDVLGVSDNNATANTIATWALNDYKCGAGQYLDEDTLTCTTCPAGSYCPGGTYTVENADEGTNACPTGYKNSDAGASSNTQCYTNCTVANANIEHATAVTGNDYYGSGTDTCVATNCELGYHVNGGGLELVEKDPLIPVDYKTAGNGYAYINPNGDTGDYNADIVPENALTANGTWASVFNYGVVYGKASCQASSDPGIVYFYNNVNAVMGGTMTTAELRTGLVPLVGESKADVMVEYVDVMLAYSSVSEESVENAVKKFVAVFGIEPDANYQTTDTGRYCYCQMDGFAPATDGALGEKSTVTSAPWVFHGDDGSADDCASDCAGNCAGGLRFDLVDSRAFRAAVFGVLEPAVTGGMCKVTETDCPAGQYLAIVGEAMMCVPCKSGSYCPGGVYTIESENKGTNACPTGYKNSDEGASADTQCYTNCKVSDIAHATAVSGNDYYGTGTDTCTATDCELGYHVDASGALELVKKEPLVPVDVDTFSGGVLRNGNGEIESLGNFTIALNENNTMAGKFNNGILYGRASCQPTAAPATLYILENLEAVISGNKSIDVFLSEFEPIAGVDKTDFAINLLNRVQSGSISMDEAQIELIAVFMTDKNANYSTSSTGQYCFVQMDAFHPNGGNKYTVYGAPWIFVPYLFENSEDCAANCIMDGAEMALFMVPDVALGAIEVAGGGSGMCVITESNCPAGTYYRKTSTTLECVPCPAGSFCPGGLFTIDSTTNGENACPAGYPKSDVGAGADTQCYKNCEVSDIPHASAVAGNDYYGTDADTCMPTKCQTGYHKIADLTVSEAGAVVSALGGTVNIDTVNNVRNNWDELYSGLSSDEQNQVATAINSIRYAEPEPSVPLEPFVVLWERMTANYDAEAGTLPHAPAAGYSYIRNVDGTEKCRAVSVVSHLFFSVAGAGGSDISCDVAAAENADVAEFRATAQNGDWFLTMPNKNIEVSGKSKCDYSESLPCRATYTSVNGRAVTENLVVGSDMSIDVWPEGSGQCETLCTSNEVPFFVIMNVVTGCAAKFAGYDMGGLNVDCSNLTALNTGLYQGMAQTMDISDELVVGGTCGANLINIDWNPDNGGAHTQNMCTYDGAITLPDDPVKPGFTFAGWKLVE